MKFVFICLEAGLIVVDYFHSTCWEEVETMKNLDYLCQIQKTVNLVDWYQDFNYPADLLN